MTRQSELYYILTTKKDESSIQFFLQNTVIKVLLETKHFLN